MRNSVFAVAFVMGVAVAGSTFASDLCDVPKDQWQPMEDLREKLEADGWEIKKMKIDDGCYEAYATDAEGRKVEVYFDPETFEPVKTKMKD